jgi:hypothetical protein
MVTFDEFAISLRIARAHGTHGDRILFTELGGFLVHFHGARQRLARIVTDGLIPVFWALGTYWFR